MLKKINNFLKDTAGSIVPMVAILAIPLVITVGATIDYTRYVNMRNEIQTGIDAAGIAAVAQLENIQKRASNLTGNAYSEFIEAELNEYAEGFLKANIADPIAKDSFTFKVDFIEAELEKKGGVSITATLEYDTIFGGINGEDGGSILFKDVITEDITSLITIGNRTVEIALVMDNSGSMAYEAGKVGVFNPPIAPVKDRRIQAMKNAASKLIDDLDEATQASLLNLPLQFSVVPFSTSVNVGNLDSENHNDDNNFLDINGFTSYNNENLDWVNTYRHPANTQVVLSNNDRTAELVKDDNTREALTRLSIFPMLNTEWEGCVEMRPYPHNIQDTYTDNTANYNKDLAEALFVPYFAPDEPDNGYFENYDGTRINTRGETSTGATRLYTSNYIPDFYDYAPETETAFPKFDNDAILPDLIVNNEDINQRQISRTNWIHKYQAYQGLDPDKLAALRDSAPISRPTPPRRPSLRGLNFFQRIRAINRYNRNLEQYRADLAIYESQPSIRNAEIVSKLDTPTFEKNLNSFVKSIYLADSGPNAFCPDADILQLTDNFVQVKNKINSMEAHGGTNIQQGLTWGWRTLSKAKPFNTGRSLTDLENRKILILLTDGNNQLIPHSSYNKTRYSAWGYQRSKNILNNATTGLDSHRRLLDGSGDTDNTIYDSKFTINSFPTMQSEYEDLMNLHTNQACNNIKNDGITIYTIAFDVEPGGKVKDLLEACAGSGKLDINNELVDIIGGVEFYHDVVGLQLEETFKEIASSISAIRIAQ